MRADFVLHSRAIRLALSPLLAPAAALYAAGLAVDRARKSARRVRLPVPVLSVGNLTVGGTGKTPVLLRLLSDLSALGLRPGVLTRGYAGAGRARREGIVVPGGDASAFSDEVRLMAAAAPDVAIGAAADRAATARTMLDRGLADVFTLDDGFQHWSLARALDIVCVDVSRPSERFVLPLGLLREPASALRRAGVVLLTRCDLAWPSALAEAEARVRALAPDAAVLHTAFEMNVDGPPRGDALAVSGIGHPGAFEAGLVKIGYRVTPFRFPDHHAYTDADLDAIERRAKAIGAIVVTTRKDWVKLATTRWSDESRRPPVRVAGQTLRFMKEGEETWRERIASALLKAA